MWEEKVGPNLKDVLGKLSGPMPIGRKIGMVLRNNLYKILHSTNCCCRPGEPGC